MRLLEIYLENFRNIERERIALRDGVNIFYGDNAQGKTNIIESIWLFSSLKSFRGAKDSDFVKKGENNARISCVFEKGGREISSEIRFFPEKRKEIYKNGIKIKTAEMMGQVNTVLFYPEHLSLIKSGPEGRRRFVDTAICQVKPQFYQVLNEYAKVLTQRNFLLRSEREDMLETLDAWDKKLARLGAVVTHTRKTYVEKLFSFAKKTVDDISGGKEKISEVYSSFGEKDISSVEKEEKTLYEKLKDSIDEDIRLKFTSEGSHRDDFTVYINGETAKIYGSQGQQRSVVMALKLAEADICNEYNEEYPVMLFDDVFSELDHMRKAYITERIKDKQVIVTTCEKIDFFENAGYFNVSGGKVIN